MYHNVSRYSYFTAFFPVIFNSAKIIFLIITLTKSQIIHDVLHNSCEPHFKSIKYIYILYKNTYFFPFVSFFIPRQSEVFKIS